MKREIPKDLSNAPTKHLLQWYANADKTCSCGGHIKGEMNESLRYIYAEELGNRGINVPKNLSEILDKNFVKNVEIPEGIFNGEGSF